MQHSQIFETPIYARTIWPRATKFGTIAMWGISVFLMASHAPSQRGGDPASPNFWTLLCTPTVWAQRRNQILYDNTGVGQKRVSMVIMFASSQGGGPSVPRISGTSYMRTHRCEENLYAVDHECRHTICLRHRCKKRSRKNKKTLKNVKKRDKNIKKTFVNVE